MRTLQSRSVFVFALALVGLSSPLVCATVAPRDAPTYTEVRSPRVVIDPNQSFRATDSQTERVGLILRQIKSTCGEIDGQDRIVHSAALLRQGEVTFDEPTEPPRLDRGVLLINSELVPPLSRTEARPVVITYPVVVRTTGHAAGAIGTTWLVMRDEQRTALVLLPSNSGGGVGEIYIKKVGEAGSLKRIDTVMHYIVAANDGSGEISAPILLPTNTTDEFQRRLLHEIRIAVRLAKEHGLLKANYSLPQGF